jgi:hypothetical protein
VPPPFRNLADSQGIGWHVTDYTEVELVAKANAAGLAQASGDYIQGGQWWRVERIVISSASANSCLATVYVGPDLLPQRARDWTPLPPGFNAIAEYPSFLTVQPASCLTFGITGAAPADVFNITVQYQLVAKTRSAAGGG